MFRWISYRKLGIEILSNFLVFHKQILIFTLLQVLLKKSIFFTCGTVFDFLEYAENGSLFEYLHNAKAELTCERILKWAKQVNFL